MVDIPGSTATGRTISVGGSVTDSLEFAGDHDWFRIELTQGQTLSVALAGLTLEDPIVTLRNSAGAVLFTNDDGGPGLDALLAFRASYTGTYYIDVGSPSGNATGTYQLNVGTYSLPPIGTLDEIAHQLTHGFWNGDVHHWDATQGDTITVNLTALTEDSRAVAREALALWTDITGVKFQEVSSGEQITFGDSTEGTGAFSDSVWSNGITTSATVNVSAQRLNLHTYIHEIGHALGLGHAGDYNNGTANSRYPYEALFLNDGSAVSVMSYFDNGENSYYADRGFSNLPVVAPQVADIIAAGNLYGLSTNTRTGNTTYGFHNNSGRDVFDAALNPHVAYTIYDSGGTDTLDYSGYSSSQRIDLNPEAFSNIGGSVGNVVIARGVQIENAIGGSGNDTIIGNAAANVLNGGAGADKLWGGKGNDNYFVDNAGDQAAEKVGEGSDIVRSSVTFTLGDNLETLRLLGSSSIHGVGNALDNLLVGNSAANSLNGGAGNDKLWGGAGADRLWGGTGADEFAFKAGEFGGLTEATAERIRDFSHAQGDHIRLNGMDANSIAGGQQHFAFIGSAGFHNVAGELRYQLMNGNTYVTGDTNGDGVADFLILLDGSHALTGGDFLL